MSEWTKKWQYKPIRYYKKFKAEYPYSVLFIKCGEYYYTYDTDAKIIMYVTNFYSDELIFKLEKSKFSLILRKLFELGLNVVLAGWKHTREYYSTKVNNYEKIKKYSKEVYRERQLSII